MEELRFIKEFDISRFHCNVKCLCRMKLNDLQETTGKNKDEIRMLGRLYDTN